LIPVNIEIKNFFSHKDSQIDFTQFDSALLIGNVDGNYDTSNGSGKSTIFEAILWSLFNKSRAAAMDDIVFWGENFCKVVFIFKHDGDLYKVVRKRSRMNSASHITFFRQDSNGNWLDISGSTPSLTNKAIVSAIKVDYKTFVNSAYFRQNDISEFAESDAARRKGILKSIIDISKWDEYEKISKGSLRELRGECKILSARLDNYEDLISSHKTASLSLKTSSKQLGEASKKRDILGADLKKMVSKYQGIKDTLDTNQWDKVSDEVDRLKSNSSSVSIKLRQADSSISSLKSTIDALRSSIDTMTTSIEKLETDPGADEKIQNLNKEAVELKAKLSVSNTMLKELDDREIHKGICYVCNQDIGDELYDDLVHTHDDEISKHKRNKIYCQNKLNELNTKVKYLQSLRANNRKLETYTSQIKTKGAELRLSEGRDEELKREQVSLSDKVREVKKDIELNNKILDSIRNDDFRSLQKKISKSRTEFKGMSSFVEEMNHDVGVLTEKTSNLKQKIDEIKGVKAEYLEKQKEMFILERMTKLLGKNGIQTILLNAVIEDLEGTANEILTSICDEPFIVYLDTQRVGSDGISIVDTLDLKVKKDGIIQNFKSLSGGEQFRISLALRIALSEISSRHGGSSLEFLLLDEINSPLDKQGTESLFVNVIRSLEKKYKIMVITHSDVLKEKFEDIIDVTKINGESTINYISI
jgi:exonuclease SbcC